MADSLVATFEDFSGEKSDVADSVVYCFCFSAQKVLQGLTWLYIAFACAKKVLQGLTWQTHLPGGHMLAALTRQALLTLPTTTLAKYFNAHTQFYASVFGLKIEGTLHK